MDQAVLFVLIRTVWAVFCLLLQLFTIPVFLLYDEFRELSCYRLMFLINVCNIVQLVIEPLSLTLALCSVVIGGLLEKVLGAFFALSNDLLMILMLILAFNRFAIIVKAVLAPAHANHQCRIERWIFRTLYAGTILYFAAGMAVFCSPFCGVYFNQTINLWAYRRDLPWSITLRNIEYGMGAFIPFIEFGIYVGILCLIKGVAPMLVKFRSPYNVASGSPNNNSNIRSSVVSQPAAPRRPLMTPQELRILIQSAVMFVMMSSGTIIEYPLDPSTITPGMVLFLDLWGDLCSGINPVMYFIVNPIYRHRLLLMFRLKKANSNGQRGGVPRGVSRTMAPVSSRFLEATHEGPNQQINIIRKTSTINRLDQHFRRGTITPASIIPHEQIKDHNGNFLEATTTGENSNRLNIAKNHIPDRNHLNSPKNTIKY